MAFIPNLDLTAIKRLFKGIEQPGPFVFGDIISPVTDITAIALLKQRESLAQQANVDTINVPISRVVEQDQSWILHAILSNTDQLDADQAIELQPMIITPGSGLTVSQARFGDRVAVAASTFGGVGFILPTPFFLTPGQTVGVIANSITVGAAGNIGVGLQLIITRILE